MAFRVATRSNFSAPQATFGFFATDIGGEAQLIFTLLHKGGPLEPAVTNTLPAQSGSALCFGVIDTQRPFTLVTFTNTLSKIDGFDFAHMTIGRREQVNSKISYPELEPGSAKDQCEP
jgi:hypothetical protein